MERRKNIKRGTEGGGGLWGRGWEGRSDEEEDEDRR